MSRISLRRFSPRGVLIRAPRIFTTAMRFLAATSKLADASKIVRTYGCMVRGRPRVPVRHDSLLRMCYWSLGNNSSSIETIQGVVVEQTVKTVNIESKAIELRTKRGTTDEGNLLL